MSNDTSETQEISNFKLGFIHGLKGYAGKGRTSAFYDLGFVRGLRAQPYDKTPEDRDRLISHAVADFIGN